MRTRILVAAVLLACGGSSDDGGSTGDDAEAPAYLIVIQGMAFSPLRLEVPPGATVTVRNRDSMPHSVTSQDARDAFSPGGVAGVAFDTGVFGGEATFTIPADAPLGTEVPYYCSTHEGTMATPNGSVLVTATPSNAAPSGGGGDTAPY